MPRNRIRGWLTLFCLRNFRVDGLSVRRQYALNLHWGPNATSPVTAEHSVDRHGRAMDGRGLAACGDHHGNHYHWSAVDARGIQHRVLYALTVRSEGGLAGGF